MIPLYNKTTYTNDESPPIDETHLNNNETQLKAISDELYEQRLRPTTEKTALVNADEIAGNDSADSFKQKRTTWTNVKAFLKTYFDTLYIALSGNQTIAGVKTFSSSPILPTPIISDNSTNAATTAFVQSKVADLNDFQAYDATKAYEINEPTFYLGVPYKSLTAANTGNTPSTSPTHWEVTGGGSGSATNVGYNFENGQFETHTIGWTRYVDAAGVIPVDGTGGPPNASTTFLRNDTVAPINGLADAILSKDDANRQGEGVSYDFTIDPGQTTSPAQITFTYKTPVEYLDGYLGVFLYDKTNGALIRMSVENIPATYGSISQFLTTFIPSTSLEYRLIFHVITDTTTQWTFEVDNIQVGQKNVAVGAAIGNWTPYILSIINGTLGTVYMSNMRRVGSNLELSVHAIITASSGTLQFNIPTGLSMVIEQAESVKGTANFHDISSGTTFHGLVEPNYLANLIQIRTISSASWWGSAQPSSYGANTAVSFICSVPIAQWTSNVNMASDFTEYASNSSATDANDYTSFVSGSGGSVGIINTTSLTAQRLKRVRFSRPIQSTDSLYLEIYDAQYGIWCPYNNHRAGSFSYNTQLNVGYGIYFSPANSTDIDVSFAPFATASSSGYGTPGESWAVTGQTGWRWRVRKVSNGNMAETRNDFMTADTGERIHKKVFTGITPLTAGTAISFTTGLDTSKVLSLTGMLLTASNLVMPFNYIDEGGSLAYKLNSFLTTAGLCYLYADNLCVNGLGRPYKLIIEYME